MVAEKTVIPSDLVRARELEEQLLKEVAECGFDDGEIFAIKLALEESFINAIRHGNKSDPNKSVRITSDINNRQVVFTISDDGPGFTPNDVPDPTTKENLEKPSGRGLMLMRAYMDEVSYNTRGNEVRLVKRRSKSTVGR